MRVRLIRPVLIELEQLDTTATKATGGYDDEFRSVRVERGADGKRRHLAVYKEAIRVLGQFEDQTQNALRMFGAGNSPEAKLAVTFDYHDLVLRDLVNRETGLPLLNVNDRLLATYRPDTEHLIMRFRKPLYAVEVRPASVGLDGTAGIVVVRFNDRQLSEAPG